MNPVAAEVRLLAIPFVKPFVSARGTQTHRNAVIVSIEDAGGLTGWGECVADATTYTAPETAATAFSRLARSLADLVALRFDTTHPLVAAAVAAAVADLTARRRGQPLAVQYGATPGPVAVGAVVGDGDPSDVIETVSELLEEGYRRIKIKVDGNHWETVAAVRSTFPTAPLAIDANGSIDPHDLAVDRLDGLRLDFVEQPFAREELTQHAELRSRSATPVCLDESIRTLEELDTATARGAADLITIKPGMVGGVDNAIAMARLAHERGVGVWVGGMLESGVGRGHSLAFARTEWMTAPADLAASNRYFVDDIVEPWTAVSGVITVPDTPGLGRSIDLGHLDRYTVSRHRVKQ